VEGNAADGSARRRHFGDGPATDHCLCGRAHGMSVATSIPQRRHPGA
jgi:hypothetical protein